MNSKLVSYCLFSFNQEGYIKTALQAAFEQDYNPLEIIVSDDSSTDKTFEIIEKEVSRYNGPHKIVINRNSENLGLGLHVSKILYTLSKGAYIITCAGDDISKTNHVSEAVKEIEKRAHLNMVDFNSDLIDSNNNLKISAELPYQEKSNSLEDYLNLRKIELFAPGRILNRRLLYAFDPISPKCPTEDSVLVMRSLLTGGFTRVNKKLVYYRKHENNLSSKASLSKLSNLSIVLQYAKDIIHSYESNKIDEKTTLKLIKRISLEYELRSLLYSKKNSFQKIMHPLKRRVLRITYLLKKKYEETIKGRN